MTTLVAASLQTSKKSKEELNLCLHNLSNPDLKIADDKFYGEVNISIEVLPQSDKICDDHTDDEVTETTPFQTQCQHKANEKVS